MYDFIIVGGGAAGCMLATHLDAQGRKVLVIERGGHVDEIENSAHVAGWSRVWNGPGFNEILSSDGKLTGEGNCLGGGATINVAIYFRETAEYFDQLPVDWSPAEIAAAYHNNEERLSSLLEQTPHPLTETILATAAENGYRRVRDDADSSPRTARQPLTFFRRYPNSDDTYRVGPGSVLAKSDVTLITYATVSRILFAGDRRARGVEFARTRINGIPIAAKDRATETAALAPGGEIILCAGAFSSPKILMLSGIGPKSNLERHGVEVLVANDEVGSNYIERRAVPLVLFFNNRHKWRSRLVDIAVCSDTNNIEISTGNTFDIVLRLLEPVPGIVRRWRWLRSLTRSLLGALRNSLGPYLTNSLTAAAFPRHLHSSGRVTLRSPCPFAPLAVAANVLGDRRDLATMIQGYDEAWSLLSHPQVRQCMGPATFFQRLLAALLPVSRRRASRRAIERFVRRHNATMFHHIGTCALGKVVDQDFKVSGVQGVRVCDTSTLPIIPTLNPQATIMMMGALLGARLTRSPSGRSEAQ